MAWALYGKSEKGQSGPSMALSARPKHTAQRPHRRCIECPKRAGFSLPMALYDNMGHGTTFLAQTCQSGHSLALHVEARRAGLGLPWHYMLSLNTPVWASHGITF